MSDIFASLRPEHPRLLAPGQVQKIQALINSDPYAQKFYTKLLAAGTSMLAEAPAEKVLVGREAHYMYMLLTSRKVLDRVYTLSELFLLTGEPRWKERAVQELRKAAQYDSWNPAHWLDVAEMINAFAVGYDLLYPALSPEEREFICQAVVEKGLKEAEIAYANQAWWSHDRFNWNNVCNGGIIVGALAFAEVVPDLAGALLTQAVENIKIALDSYAPDGAWSEGPAYWGYATRYSIWAFSALQNALGHDFDLSDLPGLNEAGWSRMHGVGPSGYFFNFADARPAAPFDPSLLWLAGRYQNPAYTRFALDVFDTKAADPDFGSDASTLLWYQPLETFDIVHQTGSVPYTPLDAHYTRTHLAFLRSSWTDPWAVYVGFKGGDNKVNHSHLDLGSFVLDAQGVRWVEELGMDEYTLPGYWEKQPGGRRWGYYRLSTSGHSTVVINGKNQSPFAEAPILDFHSEPDCARVSADLAQGYAEEGAQKMLRTIALEDRRTIVRVEDEVILDRPAEVTWQIHTSAQVQVDGSQAILTKGDKTARVQILSPEGASFAAQEIHLAEPQLPLQGVTKLSIRVAEAKEVRFCVKFTF